MDRMIINVVKFLALSFTVYQFFLRAMDSLAGDGGETAPAARPKRVQSASKATGD